MPDAVPHAISSTMPNATWPVGVFDSGVGGLSILRAIRQQLPHESLIYAADTAYLPYGARTQEEIRQRLQRITKYLLQRQIKALVVACNTATVAAISDLRTQFPDLVLVAVEPAIKPACQLTQTGIVAVLSTEYTTESARLKHLIVEYANGKHVIRQGCPGWVEFIESGNLDPAAAEACVRPQIEKLLAAGADVLVLGCTHYPFLEPAIHRIAQRQGKDITILETGAPVARQLDRLLQARNLRTQATHPTLEFLATGPASIKVFNQLSGASVASVQSLTLPA